MVVDSLLEFEHRSVLDRPHFREHGLKSRDRIGPTDPAVDRPGKAMAEASRTLALRFSAYHLQHMLPYSQSPRVERLGGKQVYPRATRKRRKLADGFDTEFASGEVEALSELQGYLRQIAEWPPDSPVSLVLMLAPRTRGKRGEMALAVRPEDFVQLG
jgi:hypothetical protein